MNSELRTKLHAIRERITKAFNDCDRRTAAIAAMDANLATTVAAAAGNEAIAAAVPSLQALRDAKAVEHATAMAAYNTLFNDVVSE